MTNSEKHTILILGCKTTLLDNIVSVLEPKHQLVIPDILDEELQLVDGILIHKSSSLITPEQVERYAESCDTAILACQPVSTKGDCYERLMAHYKTILESFKQSQIKRVIIIGGGASLQKDNKQYLIDSKYYNTQNKKYIQILQNINEWLITSNMPYDWLFIVPPEVMLPNNQDRTIHLDQKYIKTNTDGYSIISFHDFAITVAHEIQKPRYHKTQISVAYN